MKPVNGPILEFSERDEWRKWLFANHDKEKEAWLVNPKKISGKIRIPYNDAVEEALCVNWIDSINRSIDDHHAMQRYSPRKKGSSYSQANLERLRWLLNHNMMHPDFREMTEELLSVDYVFPERIINEIRKDKIAWKNYQSLPDGYKRIRIAYIDAAGERSEEYLKRLSNFILHTRSNILLKGYGGIEKYYHP